MALISATTIIRSLAIFHLTIAYFLLTSPSTIVDQNLVYILGAAMDMVNLPALIPFPTPFRPFPSIPFSSPFKITITLQADTTSLLPTLKPSPQSLTQPTPATALAALILSLLALADLTASSLPAEISTFYWGSQTPVRLLFFFVVTAYSYVFKQGGERVGGGFERNRLGRGLLGGGERWGGDELKNSLVFSWGFVELLCWFWVYATLRDERRETIARMMEKKKAEEDRL